jgi:hypothetical protein
MKVSKGVKIQFVGVSSNKFTNTEEVKLNQAELGKGNITVKYVPSSPSFFFGGGYVSQRHRNR